ncbi:MAG: methylmalonyl Co-A mutase-associated GTPase MeaB [Rubrimonas sp.]|uniref:methylmalonyl Co-A mutase-associated GTPase MeaB n=1 Tax=Rubrimonas sp. TaxID=2036015 RepID=UPI002FDEAE8F
MTAPKDAPPADAAAADLAAGLAARLRAGERRALARAITLAESTRPDHRATATALLERLGGTGDALRVGLSGAPGVGKSTFIEGLGMGLIARGLRVAVLAVDPSSARTGGSILGDKTRMDRLSREPRAFIRPSPSGGSLGGVARRTREAVALCEAAGFDVVLVETVGVGQSEFMVAEMTDVFALLLSPGGGDELQGVKRGVMEIADLILVNKADGDMADVARRTCADYAGALRLLRRRPHDPEGWPRAATVSALTEAGVMAAWDEIAALDAARRARGWRAKRRASQAAQAFRRELEEGLKSAFRADPQVAALLPDIERAVLSGALAPEIAAARALDAFLRR